MHWFIISAPFFVLGARQIPSIFLPHRKTGSFYLSYLRGLVTFDILTPSGIELTDVCWIDIPRISFPPILIMNGVRACRCALFLSFIVSAYARTHGVNPKTSTELAKSYLQMLKLSLTGELLKTDSIVPGTGAADQLKKKPFDAHLRSQGLDWPSHGLTMVGRMRLENIERLLLSMIDAHVPGDFVECGVWRGGSSLFARGILKALNVHDRKVHLVDSFEGLPKASQAKDRDVWSEMDFLKVSLEEVQEPFRQLGLLDPSVAFHKGFFQHSLPPLRKQLLASNRTIAVLRMDGDMFESTMDILYNLYDLVSVGGCIIIDDFAIREAKEAVETFLKHHALIVDYITIDESSSYFCKELETKVDSEWYEEFNKKRTRASSAP